MSVSRRSELGGPATVAAIDRTLDESNRYPTSSEVGMSQPRVLVGEINGADPGDGTIHGADGIAGFVETVRQRSPETVILIDEACHDYVTEPAYESAVPMALETPNMVVTRTSGTLEEMERATQASGEILTGRTETTDTVALAAGRAGRQAARAA